MSDLVKSGQWFGPIIWIHAAAIHMMIDHQRAGYIQQLRRPYFPPDFPRIQHLQFTVFHSFIDTVFDILLGNLYTYHTCIFMGSTMLRSGISWINNAKTGLFCEGSFTTMNTLVTKRQNKFQIRQNEAWVITINNALRLYLEYPGVVECILKGGTPHLFFPSTCKIITFTCHPID